VCVALLYFVIFTRWAAGGAHAIGLLADTWARREGPAGRRKVGAWRYFIRACTAEGWRDRLLALVTWRLIFSGAHGMDGHG
jgi:hypothetical protein